MRTIPGPEDVDLMTMQDFYKTVRCGAITNWDGSGYPANPPLMDDDPIDCREIYKGVLPMGFTHVAWFNK